HSHNGTDDDIALVRYNADGTADTSFGGGDGIVTTAIGPGDDVAQSVTVQTDGKILVTGSSDNGADSDFTLIRYNADGTLDTSFGGTGIITTDITGPSDEGAESVAVQSDGKILVAGTHDNGSDNVFALVRYNNDGTLDSSFGGGDGIVTTTFGLSSHVAHSIALQPDGKILVAGQGDDGTGPDFTLARYNTDGTLDISFGAGDGFVTTDALGYEGGYSLDLQSDGRILVAGYTYSGGYYQLMQVRYNTDGALDTTYGMPNFTEGGAAVVLNADVDVSDSELNELNGGLGNYDGAGLTLVRDGGANSDDVLSFNDGNGITLSGSNLIKNSQVIATFDITTTPGELVITFTDANGEIPTSTDVDNILRQITYANSS
ncbi:MAG: hypothetical protein GY788_32675, partial [bacterium]|nr:hypothetical protein [bacterium]